ncbi:hypothetical protein HZH66_004610 [Vespula vulgaris]|uniref:Uncharacterized protein n=1 Tax=Vespula vulgaris TaxID=7454 RepID=A0A834K971_VESVU|nr:hypothetical protein HZH66_004610 [Vespula vulgaris]
MKFNVAAGLEYWKSRSSPLSFRQGLRNKFLKKQYPGKEDGCGFIFEDTVTLARQRKRMDANPSFQSGGYVWRPYMEYGRPKNPDS